MHPSHVLLVVLPVWLLFLVRPRIAMNVGVLVYLCFVTCIGWSAVRHRGKGWLSGILLALLLGTLPGWVGAMFGLYQSFVEQ
jgi:hypothetical protein